jgi:hypothetical protein
VGSEVLAGVYDKSIEERFSRHAKIRPPELRRIFLVCAERGPKIFDLVQWGLKSWQAFTHKHTY